MPVAAQTEDLNAMDAFELEPDDRAALRKTAIRSVRVRLLCVAAAAVCLALLSLPAAGAMRKRRGRPTTLSRRPACEDCPRRIPPAA